MCVSHSKDNALLFKLLSNDMAYQSIYNLDNLYSFKCQDVENEPIGSRDPAEGTPSRNCFYIIIII